MNIKFALVIGAAVAAVGLGIAGAAAGTATPVGADMRLVAAGTSADVGSKVRDKIVDIGSNEVGKKRSVETGGNCNYYSRALNQACQEWCADFARWTWGKAGVDTSGLSAAAASFAAYGRKHGSWHPGRSLKGVKPGDVIVYDLNRDGTWASHVVIVQKVDKKTGKITVVSGNSGRGTDRVTSDELDRSRVSGYVRPHGKKGTTGKDTTKTGSGKPTSENESGKPKKTADKKPAKTTTPKPKKSAEPEPTVLGPGQVHIELGGGM